MTATRVGPALGAVVTGIDLRSAGADDVAADLRTLLDEHQVLFFRDQHLDTDEQIRVASFFGEVGPPEPFGTLDGADAPVALVQVRSATRPPQTDRWHTDTSFLASPPVVGTLCAEVVPSLGGDTAWVSLYAIYDALSEPLRALCAQLEGEHTWANIRDAMIAIRGADAVAAAEALLPAQRHPLVRTHPRTGRSYLYLGGAPGAWLSRVVGPVHPAEADLVLGYLQRLLDTIEFQTRWHWTPGDFVVWEEATTNHLGMSDHFAVDPDRTVRSVWSYDPARRRPADADAAGHR
jgi:taurine dioxygenase